MNSSPSSAADRRRAARQARDAFPPMGVYAIRNEANGAVHVGSSRNVHGTLNRIRFELRLGTHPHKALQAEWKRDPSTLRFEVLELVKERSDPAFDYVAELKALEEIHRFELCEGGRP